MNARSRDPKRINPLLPAPSRGFPRGATFVTQDGARRPDERCPGMDFGILRLGAGQKWDEATRMETVLVLLDGDAEVTLSGEPKQVHRSSLFDQNPVTFHCGRGTPLAVKAGPRGAEFALIRTDNARQLPARYYGAGDVATEDRGAGLAQGACRRLVRTIFDYSTRPDSNLVVGEVVNFPGRWSSYPGHHHPQPEIYHYRFTMPQGYGHAEVGDDVYKVRHGDTVAIPGGLDHAQVSAPGYGMYYLWVVRHLPRRPYRGFTFSAQHRWLLDPARQGWQPILPPT
jgi:5-deoxy-glucuronate isomerase